MTLEIEEHKESIQATLKCIYAAALKQSLLLPESQRLIVYDPHDDSEVFSKAGPFVRRLDGRRASKPKPQLAGRVNVCTPVDPEKFNFTKIRNADEVLYTASLNGARYNLLTNKFPLCTNHMLLVSADVQPQQMNMQHLGAVVELIRDNSMFAYFNSWGAAASVNHLHLHVIDEQPPILKFPLEAGGEVFGCPYQRMKGYPGFNFVFSTLDLYSVGQVISLMQKENQPHNLFFSGEHVYVFPRSINPESQAISLDIYGEKVGGLEFTGIFTVYSEEKYEAMSYEVLAKLLRLNSSPLMQSAKLCTSSSTISIVSSDASTTAESDTLSDDEALCIL